MMTHHANAYFKVMFLSAVAVAVAVAAVSTPCFWLQLQ